MNDETSRPSPSTFSIVATDPQTGEIGLGVQSKFLAVGGLMAFPRTGVGAVASQSFADVTFGPRGLELLASGLDPQAVLDQLLGPDDARESRQVGIVDASGRSASFTGGECFEHASSETGPGYACQGNIMANERVVPAMAMAFEAASGDFPERLLESLRSAQREGGDRRGQESAALLVAKAGGGYGANHDRYIDLRVDDHPEPIEELARLLDLHRLYLERPREDEILAVDPELEAEIRETLTALGWVKTGGDVWDALSDYMGWQNLEERWVGRGRIDPRVLEYLRQDPGAAPSS